MGAISWLQPFFKEKAEMCSHATPPGCELCKLVSALCGIALFILFFPLFGVIYGHLHPLEVWAQGHWLGKSSDIRQCLSAAWTRFLLSRKKEYFPFFMAFLPGTPLGE